MLKGDDLTTFIVPKVEKIRSLNLLIPKGLLRPVAGKLYLFMYLCIVYLMTLSAARNIGRRMAEWLMNVELESSDRRQSQCRFWCLPGVSEETKDIVFLTFSAILLMSVPFTIYSASNRTSAPNTEIINK